MKGLKTLEMVGCIHSRSQRQILQNKASQSNMNLILVGSDGDDSSDSDEEKEQMSDNSSDSSAEGTFLI